jgi:mannosyltransferase OCH1-like enzyme
MKMKHQDKEYTKLFSKLKVNIKNRNNTVSVSSRNETIHHTLSKTYPMKNNYNPIIPFNIFQTWHSKTLPPIMFKVVNKIKQLNPRFNYYLFDDHDCENFIAHYFKEDVLNAYRKLVPGAYKADLWRYCVLFIKGGIYLDIKYKPNNNFRFINLTESEHFCFDIDGSNIYNAIMVCKQGNLSCLTAIRQIVKHVNMHYYGNSALDPTGPRLLARCITQNNKFNIDMKHGLIHHNFENRYIKWNDYYILHQYKGYLDESAKYAKTNHYSAMWSARQIYN